MSTQKPLAELIPAIIEHYNRYVDYLEMNRRLYEIAEGQLLEEVRRSLSKEIISPKAFERAVERIPSINVVKKVTDKLSKVYIENPTRLADTSQDIEIMENINRIGSFNHAMGICNFFYNLHRMYALEPFVDDKGKQSFRVLGGHQFLPFSDDPSDPMNMTVFIKLMGTETQVVSPRFDINGEKQSTEDEIRTVNVLALYSDDEFLIIDTGGGIRTDKMREMGINIGPEQQSSPNPFERIPFQYGNKSKTELVPFPNQEGLNMAILIPKLFTDLNFASQFMSHSIIWVRNSDLTGEELNPDAVVNLGERTEENGDPEMGVISPSVDIQNVLALIEHQLQGYLSAVGIKSSAMNNISPGQESSGVAKAIDEGDTTDERKVQVEFFRDAELKIWDLIDTMQDIWIKGGILTQETRRFTENFIESFVIIFSEMKPLKSVKQKIEEVQLLRDQGLITKRSALKKIFPELTEAQLDKQMKEIEEESKKAFDDMIGNSPALSAERSTDGTFNEGNEAGTNQTPENNLASRKE